MRFVLECLQLLLEILMLFVIFPELGILVQQRDDELFLSSLHAEALLLDLVLIWIPFLTYDVLFVNARHFLRGDLSAARPAVLRAVMKRAIDAFFRTLFAQLGDINGLREIRLGRDRRHDAGVQNTLRQLKPRSDLPG